MLPIANQTPRYSLLQRFQRIGQRIPLRFAKQQVHMLRHNYIPVNLKPETVADALQGQLKDSACIGGKQKTTMVAAERDEVALTTVRKTRESPWHEDNLAFFTGLCL